MSTPQLSASARFPRTWKLLFSGMGAGGIHTKWSISLWVLYHRSRTRTNCLASMNRLFGSLWRKDDCSHSPDPQRYQDSAQWEKDSRHADYPRYPIHRNRRSKNRCASFPSPLRCRCSYQAAGVEKSRVIRTSEINTTTLKLTALASIMERLMQKKKINRPSYSWSRDAHSFSTQLAKNFPRMAINWTNAVIQNIPSCIIVN